MDPRCYPAKDIETLHKLFRAFRPHAGIGNLFRGQADVHWPPIPKAGRPEYFLPDLEDSKLPGLQARDLGRFNQWKERVFPFVPNLPPNDYEALAYAQHHGLATRLLDWSLNPLVATYFAVRELNEVDGAVFCYAAHGFIEPTEASLPIGNNQTKQSFVRLLESGNAAAVEAHIKNMNGRAFVTRAFDSRMLNQRGAFTIHWPPNATLPAAEHPVLPSTPNLAILVIPAKLKRELREHLNDYGISEEFIFPDADGVSAHVNWETREMNKG